ncbi:Methyltransferase-like protein 16 [Gonapodya sp. JEL0774]|nr:Methyltransferase-like protein 16 [Gonapodya sp. JEL0774]
MHPHNPFLENPPDFAQIARLHPPLARHLSFSRSNPGYATINFHDARAARELCYALLATRFNIRLEIPLDSLIPPIPNRIDYLLWCLDLVKECSNTPTDAENEHSPDLKKRPREAEEHEQYVNHSKKIRFHAFPPLSESHSILKSPKSSFSNAAPSASATEPILAIDIGTGCSCIYPLLGVRLEPRLRFLALDNDERSAEYARGNVEMNALSEKIRVVLNKQERTLFPLELFDPGYFLEPTIHQIPLGLSCVNAITRENAERAEVELDVGGAPSEVEGQSRTNGTGAPEERTGRGPNEVLPSPNPIKPTQKLPDESVPTSVSPTFISTTGTRYHFTICNPPFFRDPSDRQHKVTPASSTHCGSYGETIFSGGEVEFIRRMFLESQELKDKVEWWTSLVGKKEDLDVVEALVRQRGVEVRKGRMQQGRTVRWAIAWRWNE